MKRTTVLKRLLCFALCAAFIAGALPLAGCVTNYKRRDIVNYVSEKYGISGFKVSSKRQELHGEDGRTDYLWTVKESDGTVFYVIDNRYYGTEWTTNELTDNRGYILLSRYIEENGDMGFELRLNDCDAGWPDEMRSTTLIADYRSRAELRSLIDKLNGISAALPAGCRIPFLLRFDHKFRAIGDYENSAADFTKLFSSPDTIEYSEAEKDYLHTALDMRYEENIADFSEDEIHKFVKGSGRAIVVINSDSSCVISDDLVTDPFGYGVSFATMYEIMTRNGYPVEGGKDDYTFTGADGCVYEFSNYFSDGDWYYYLKDGERVQMEYYFYNHIYPSKVESYCGIKTVEYFDYEKHKDEYTAVSASDTPPEDKTTAYSTTTVITAKDDAANGTGTLPVIVISAGGKLFYAQPEDNLSAEAFMESLRSAPLELKLSDYGGFEKVGPIGYELPTTDEEITTVPGDIILYQGDKLTIYYGENTWTFTRLAHINNVTREQLLEALGEGDVTVWIWVEWQEQ